MPRKLRQLTQQEYFRLQSAYDNANENVCRGGDHVFVMMELRKMGFTEVCRENVMKIALQLLENGYK